MADKDDIIACHAAGTLPQLFIGRIRRHRSADIGKAFCKTIVALHNAGTIDVLEAARTIGQSPISQTDFFFVQTVFVELIPKLGAEVSAMLAAVKALVARAGDDLAGGRPNDAYRIWAATGDRALATLATIDPDDPNDAAYVFLSLRALAETEPEMALNRAISLLAGKPSPAQSAAAKALGTLPLPTSNERIRAVDALEAALKSGSDDNLLSHILTAVCEIARARPEMEPSALALIAAANLDAGDRVIHQVSLELMLHSKDSSPAIVAALTSIANNVQIHNRGTLSHIDHAASALIRGGRIDEALALIIPLISAHNELTSLENFKSTSYSLRELDGNNFSEIIVSWLLACDANLGLAALSLVSDHHGSPLVLDFDASSLALSDADAILLAHRAIGYLFIHPITAASLVLALIRLADPEPQQVMAEILFDPLLINYSGELAEWLETKVKDKSELARPLIADLLARLEAYMDGLRTVGHIKEMRPSERERLIETHRQHEAMRQLRKEAENNSVLMSLVNRSVLLYGNRLISYFEGPDGKKQRNQMQLQSVRHSFEAPRLDILEPFDLDYTLRMFRAMRTTR